MCRGFHLHETAHSERGQDAVYDRLGQAERLGDLGHTKSGFGRAPEQVEHVEGAGSEDRLVRGRGRLPRRSHLLSLNGSDKVLALSRCSDGDGIEGQVHFRGPVQPVDALQDGLDRRRSTHPLGVVLELLREFVVAQRAGGAAP